MRTYILASILVLLLLSTVGCYKVSLSDTPSDSIYTRAFSNLTFFHRFDETFNLDLRQILANSSVFKVSEDPDKATYLLDGEIDSITKKIIRSGRDELPLEYQFRCRLTYTFTRQAESSKPSTRSLTRSWRYLPPYGETEESVLGKLSKFLAEELVRDLQIDW